MKKLIILFGSIATLGLTGCLKDKPNVDFSQLQPVIEISTASTVGTPGSLASGTENFSSATLNFAVQDSTATFDVNLASNQPLNKDINVTVAVDNTQLTNYPAFTQTPDSIYTIDSKTQTIKAGSRIARFTVHFYPSKIDPSQSYLLPIKVTDASGITISGNFSTIFFHIVGNPLAGAYLWDWTRYNNQDGSGAPTSSSFTGHNTVFTPVSATTISVPSGYYIQPNYNLSFTNNNGVLSNFQLTFDPNDVAKMAAGGVTIFNGPNILLADPVNHKFKFQYVAYNGSGYRYIIDYYYKP